MLASIKLRVMHLLGTAGCEQMWRAKGREVGPSAEFVTALAQASWWCPCHLSRGRAMVPPTRRNQGRPRRAPPCP